MANVHAFNTNIQRHADNCKRRHAQRQGFGYRPGQPRHQRDLQHRRDDGPYDGEPVLKLDTPAALSNSDTSQVNLGVRFTSSPAGIITGIKYYKGANDTGTHTGSLWSSTGTLLATATFIKETTSGWQTVTFSNPVSIIAGTTYVASFHSNGHYANTANYFTTALPMAR